MLENKEQRKGFKKAVKILKKIELDGESTQDLLEEIGMGDQMLRQLIMSMPIDVVDEYYNERLEYDGIKHPINHRLNMIKDDLKVIHRCIPTNLLNLATEYNDDLKQCFNNILIACDLKDNESLTWKLYSEADVEPKTIDDKLNEFVKLIAINEPFFEYDSRMGTCHLVCSGSKHSYNITPFFDDAKGIPVELCYDGETKGFFMIEYDKPINDEQLEQFKTIYLQLVEMLIRSMV